MEKSNFINQLNVIVGRRHVLSNDIKMRRFLHGYRFGSGKAVAVVRPRDLVELWRVAKLCVETNRIIIAQAANTGLTGGSTPMGDKYDREVVVINTMRIKGIQPILNGQQVICLPGATLDELELSLKPLNREPHSVIGSSCLGASVFGGVCNNSGGSLIRRGPTYTEQALFARVTPERTLELVNHLGIKIDGDAEHMLRQVQSGEYSDGSIDADKLALASDREYIDHVRDIDSPTPARYNADPRRLFEASGSTGKLLVFAVRLDTFATAGPTKVLYIGSNDEASFTKLRRDILKLADKLPISAEYMHADAFDIADTYGKDVFMLIKLLGTKNLPKLFALKSWVDGLAQKLLLLPDALSDHIMQTLSKFFPDHLPKRMRDYRSRYEHHLMMKVELTDAEALETYLSGNFKESELAFFQCTDREGADAFLHRFAAAGAAVRFRAVHGQRTGGIVALDVALPRNASSWIEVLPASINKRISHKLYYGHFFCHVFHQDYILRAGEDWEKIEHDLLKIQDERNAHYPAEHNFGHLYEADEAVIAHYKDIDPCNCFNPGIGKSSKRIDWQK